ILHDEAGLRVTLLADVAAIRVCEVRCERGVDATTQAHPGHIQSFYVLAGEMALRIGDRDLRAPAGAWIALPAARPYAVSACDAAVRYLDLRAPAG
ncbi:MAG TPA: cupin domain-containing protein, partial [Solirubrobacteraceae bacterium]|nr:cupin domain-containing protein [Solirubrobacteraceae bacterium]